MARRSAVRPALVAVPCSSPPSSIAAILRAVAAESKLAKRPRSGIGLDAADPAETIEQREEFASATLAPARGWDAGRRPP